MAATPKWSVQHRCGHRINWDLNHKPPDRRVGFAAWLAMRDCTRCWWTKRRNPDRRIRAILRPARPGRQRARSWEATAGMPALEGSNKAASWATSIRRHLLLAARDQLGNRAGAEEEFARRYSAPARRITTAAWWIDHRRVTPGQLRKALASAAPRTTNAATTTREDR